MNSVWQKEADFIKELDQGKWLLSRDFMDILSKSHMWSKHHISQKVHMIKVKNDQSTMVLRKLVLILCSYYR